MSSLVALLLAVKAAQAATTFASPPAVSTVEPTLASIEAVAATATPVALVSTDVKGVAFDRFYQIWAENEDYSAAAGDPNQKFLASQGITLTNYWATTHPSEPNYCAVVGGDNFGMDNDDFHSIPANVSTVVDLLDTKGISWAEFQEHIPYPGFEGFNFSNQATYANDYVRKHDPLILYESVTNNATRLGLIQNFTGFETALASKNLPQWAFITPNMTDDGHDTNVTFASTWERDWLAPLMNNSYFMNNTLILVTWDEVETYTTPNKPFAVLLGGAIPDHLKGTTDDTFYNHYSTIATVSANWGLPSLGRWDCSANVLQIVANKTGYANKVVDTKGLFMNMSYPGPLSDDEYTPTWPNPETSAKCASGMGVLAAVANTFKGTTPTYNYSNPFPYLESAGVNTGITVTNGTSSGSSSAGGPTATAASGSSTATATSSGTVASSSSAADSSSQTMKFAGVVGAFLATVVVLQS